MDSRPDAKRQKRPYARACKACNLKKTKCDMGYPQCSLCKRTRKFCSYPSGQRRQATSSDSDPSQGEAITGEQQTNNLDQIFSFANPETLETFQIRRPTDDYPVLSTMPQLDHGNGSNQSDSADVNQNMSDPSPNSDNISTAYLSAGQESRNHFPDFSNQPVDNGAPQDFSASHAVATDQNWATFSQFQGIARHSSLDATGMQAPFYMPTGEIFSGSESNFEQIFNQSPGTILAETLFRGVQQGSHTDVFDISGTFSQAIGTTTATENQNRNRQTSYTMSVPSDVVDDLVDIFFKNISCFVPLLHRPTFYAKYNIGSPDGSKYDELRLEDALILNGILALSARFSTHPHFSDVPPKQKSTEFVAVARNLYRETTLLDGGVEPSLPLLQACILLAFYYQLCETSSRSWSMIGVCCRMAYDLGLNTTDEDILDHSSTEQWTSVSDWVRREERRRAWWLAWELDAFASSVLCRPFTIDRHRMSVLLPVSDAQWFSNTPQRSIPIINQSLNAWKTLQDSPNQDDRAWFLVATFLKVIAHDLVHNRQVSQEEISEFEDKLTCFTLLLPPRFQVKTHTLRFTEENFVNCNLIVSTILLLNSTRLIIQQKSRFLSPPPAESQKTPPAEGSDSLILRLIRDWHSDYIVLACPLVAGTLIGPAAANVQAVCDQARESGTTSSSTYLELIKLVLRRIGEYWEIGSTVHKIICLLESRSEIGKADLDAVKGLPLLVPQMRKW